MSFVHLAWTLKHPRDALASLGQAARGWFVPQPDTMLLNSAELSFISIEAAVLPIIDDVRAPSTQAALRVVELPIESVLVQKLGLPERARHHLNHAIQHNLPQWSPFSAEEVLIAHQAGQKTGITFELELRYVLRADVERIVEPLRSLGLNPVAVALGGRGWLAVLDRATLAKRAQRRQRLRLLSLLVGMLVIGLCFSIGWRQQNQLELIEQRRFQAIADLRRVSDEVIQLRRTRDAHHLARSLTGRTAGEIALALAATLPSSVSPRAMTIENGVVRLVVAADAAEMARASLANNIAFEKSTVEPGNGDEATIMTTFNPASTR